MWQIAAISFVVLLALTLIMTEILRSIIDRKRVRQQGMGGTQDIAMWGTIIGVIWMFGAGVSTLGWLFTR